MITFAEFITENEDKTWEVSYDHGPHKSNTIKVKAKSQSHAWEVAKEVAKKDHGHARITSGSVTLVKEEKRGLWKNIHDKEKRIKNGSKEHMRKPGSEGAPTKQDFVNSQTEEVAAWQRKEGKNPEGGLNKKGVESYRRENPGSKLQTAVTTKPSKLKKGSKAANRRKSFCARMSGMKKRLTSSETANDPNSRINKSLRKWNC